MFAQFIETRAKSRGPQCSEAQLGEAGPQLIAHTSEIKA